MGHIERFAWALRPRGFATLDLRADTSSPFVDIDKFTSIARQHFTRDLADPWDAISNHIATLKAWGIRTVALRASAGKLIVIPLHYPDGWVAGLDEFKVQFANTREWIKRLDELIPDVTLDDDTKASVRSTVARIADIHSPLAAPRKPVSGPVLPGNAAGADPADPADPAEPAAAMQPAAPAAFDAAGFIAAMAGELLIALAEAGSNGGACVTVHAISGPPSASLRGEWSALDLTDQPVWGETWAMNFMWDVKADTIIPAGASWAENVKTNPFLRPSDLQNAIRGVAKEFG